MNLLDPRDSEEVDLCLRLTHPLDPPQARENLQGLERDHPAQGDVAVTELLKLFDSIGVGRRAPALGNPDGRKGAAEFLMQLDELLGQVQRDPLASPPLLRHIIKPKKGVIQAWLKG